MTQAWWGRSSTGSTVYHLARQGTGTRSVCGKVNRVIVADHVVDGPLCAHCLEQVDPKKPAASSVNIAVANALAEFVRRMMPFARLTNHEVASLVAIFCASYFDRGYGHPKYQAFVDGVYEAVLARLGGCEVEEPRLTKVERLWRVKQAVTRRSPRVDGGTWADRWRRARLTRERREHEDMLRVRCEACGAMPDDCECEGED